MPGSRRQAGRRHSVRLSCCHNRADGRIEFMCRSGGVVAVPYIYGDLFWLFNGAVDALLLYVSGRLAGCRIRLWRLLCGASLGATYALGFLYAAPGPLYHPAAKAAVPAVMLAAAYWPLSGRDFIRLGAWFAATAAFVAGAAAALGGAQATNLWAGAAGKGVPAWAVAVGLVLPLIGGRAAWSSLHRRWARQAYLVPVEIAVAGRQAFFTGLLDTGNRMEDPLNGAPVIVAELAAVAPLLPEQVVEVYSREGTMASEQAARALSEGAWRNRFRLLPFSSLGQRNGLLLGFRPDTVAVSIDGRRREVVPVTVAVAPSPLSSSGEYQALLPPQVAAAAGGGWGKGRVAAC